MRNARLLVLPLFAALAFATGGCGPGTTKVSGKVTYKGQPVTGGTVSILPTSGKGNPVTAELNEKGEFEVTAPIGDAKITVDNRALEHPDKGAIGASGDYSDRGKDAQGAGGAPPGGGPPGGRRPGMPPIAGGGAPGQGGGPAQMPKNDENMRKAMAEKGAPSSTAGKHVGTYMKIPAKYNSGSTTDITVTIKSGEPLNIDLKD